MALSSDSRAAFSALLPPVDCTGTLYYGLEGAMSNQIDRRTLLKWLLAHGFAEAAGTPSGHRQFTNGRVKVTIPGHGPQDLTKKHVALLLRALEADGFDRKQSLQEWQSGRWD
jgi:predicted RNA binding protein YcfA (HicA-like mRNA interferase family)